MKKWLVCILIGLVCVCLPGCRTAPEPSESDTLTETPPPETASETEEYMPAEMPESKRPLVYTGSMALHELHLPPEMRNAYTFDYDGRYVLFVTSVPAEGSSGGANERKSHCLYILDKMTGAFLPETFPLADTESCCFSLHEEDGYAVLCATYLIEGTADYVVPFAYRVREEDGVFRLEETEREAYPEYSARIVSPDGTYSVCLATTDGYGDGGVMLRDASGQSRELLANQTWEETKGLEEVKHYSPLCFLDNTRFLFNIGGWEWTIGYGVYDVETDTAVEYRNGKAVVGYDADRGLCITYELGVNYEPLWYEETPGGEGTPVWLFPNEQESQTDSCTYQDGCWIRTSAEKMEILSADRTETRGTFDGAAGDDFWNRAPLFTVLYLYGDSVTVLVQE